MCSPGFGSDAVFVSVVGRVVILRKYRHANLDGDSDDFLYLLEFFVRFYVFSHLRKSCENAKPLVNRGFRCTGNPVSDGDFTHEVHLFLVFWGSFRKSQFLMGIPVKCCEISLFFKENRSSVFFSEGLHFLEATIPPRFAKNDGI